MSELAEVSRDLFLAVVGSEIALEDAAGQSVAVQMEAAIERPRSTAPGSKRTSFTLILTVPGARAFASGHYDLVHPAFGRIGPVHVSRTAPQALNSDMAFYEISFN